MRFEIPLLKKITKYVTISLEFWWLPLSRSSSSIRCTPKKNTGADEARVPWLKTAGWLQRNDTVDGRKPGNPLRLVGYPIKNRVL